MKKKILTGAVVVLAVALAPLALAGPGIGDPAPDFTLYDVNNVSHSLSDFEGKVVVLNFWASW